MTLAATATALADGLHFRVGARTLFTLDRRLVRVALSLEQALDGHLPTLPPLPPGTDGYLVTSLPADRVDALTRRAGDLIPLVRQRYTRFHADLSGGSEAWWAALSANTRSQMKRKTKRLAAIDGGMRIERFATAPELAAFHPVARAISARTYQERRLDCGLPDDAGFLREMALRGTNGTARAWILYIGEAPVAYLYCPVEGGTVIYEYVGHDPAFAELSPGAVLHVQAMRDLADEGRFARFDFTEGEGQHKRQLSTDGVAACDVMLLRARFANRIAAMALSGFDGGVARAKALSERLGMTAAARRATRGR